MKYVLFVLICLCVSSCHNRYHDWEKFYTNLNASASYSIATPENMQNLSEDVMIQYAISSSENINIDNISWLPNDIANYIIAKQHLNNENTQKAIDMLSSQLPEKSNKNIGNNILEIESSLLLCTAYLEGNQSEKAKFILDRIDTLSIPLSPKLQQYFTVKCLLFESYILNQKSLYKNSLACLHYGLYQIEHDLKDFILLKNEFILRKATYQIAMGKTYLQNSVEILESLSAYYAQNRNIASGLNSNLMTCYFQIGDTIKVDSIRKILLLEIDSLLPKYQNYVVISIFNTLRANNRMPEAYEILNKYNDANSDGCHKNQYVLELYKAFHFISQGNFSQAKLLTKSIDVPTQCPIRLQKLIQFYTLETLKAIQNQEQADISIDTLLSQAIAIRSLAAQLYVGDEELHLEDFYSQNQEYILGLFKKYFISEIPIKYLQDILMLIHSTRNREWNREFLLAKSDINLATADHLSEINNTIREGLRLCNEFLEYEDLGAIHFKTLYEAYSEKTELLQKSNGANTYQNDLNILALNEKLKASNTQLLDISLGDKYYWFVVYDGQKMQLEKMERVEIDNFIDEYLRQIHSSKHLELPKTKHFTFQMIRKWFDSKKKTTILPDGQFANFPFDLFDKDYQLSPSLFHIANNNLDTILASKSYIFSFSDAESRKILDKNEVAELYHDYEECYEIHQILGNKSNFFHGENSTISKLNKATQGDLLHVATHAVGDSTNRLNSYFYLRDQQKNPQKFYLSQIYNYQKTPKFVCLSACKSGIGKHIDGQGTFSLSRPFFTRGSKTVIKTLWDTDDIASTQFMRHLYTSWEKGKTVGEAFHHAKKYLQSSSTYNHPKYWACYVLEGNENLYISDQ